MTDRDRDRPLEESPEVAAAVEDDIGIPQLMTGGGADRDTPSFAGPGDRPGGDARGDELIGEPYASGAAPQHIRTGAEQPWEPEDLVAARGRTPRRRTSNGPAGTWPSWVARRSRRRCPDRRTRGAPDPTVGRSGRGPGEPAAGAPHLLPAAGGRRGQESGGYAFCMSCVNCAANQAPEIGASGRAPLMLLPLRALPV
ncbi:hypothetical protein GA0070608_3134 [Micromonospora peucetia]|uniref:Uncharacterized protein n=1 Tax=Micromonospora peucetia TaxID=47871 RepID=A0A1C6VGY3_9ACTN|nr:hypothetical protein GA0070608_3134 [Micromonospora peucetia]